MSDAEDGLASVHGEVAEGSVSKMSSAGPGSSGGPGARGGSARVLAKLRTASAEGRFYEAHQMYRTIYFRFMAQKRFGELTELLYEGALLFLEQGQSASGGDLSGLLVDVLLRSQKPPCDEQFERLARLFSLMARSSPERQSFLAAALRWSACTPAAAAAAEGDGKGRASSDASVLATCGHPRLHRRLGLVLWQEKSYPEARFHLLQAGDGPNCARLLVEFHTQRGFPSEVDLFIVRAVLHLLCLRDKGAASSAFKGYTAQHPGIRRVSPPFLLPLLNFIWCLLQAVESGEMSVFTVLLEQYHVALQRDPSYLSYLERIGQLFFGLIPARPSAGPGGPGLLGDLLQAFMGGMDDSDSDGEGSGSSRAGGGASTGSSGAVSTRRTPASLLEGLLGGRGQGQSRAASGDGPSAGSSQRQALKPEDLD